MRSVPIIAFLLLPSLALGTLWPVGPGQAYTAPSQVSDLVSDGDTVDIEAGVYPGDVARWQANDLLLRGVGGLAHLESNGLSWGDKAIWVIQGDRCTVEHIAFSECAVPDQNGAGIRQEGLGLTVRHCWFHHNENGILCGELHPSTIRIEHCEFGYNGHGDGFSHNLYIGAVDSLIFRFNYSHHALAGHELKSRAWVNIIEYNRFSNEADGTASREIDLPDGGQAFVIGNAVQQGPQGQNGNLLGFGVESLSNPGPQRLYVINNTFVNERATGNYLAMPNSVLLKAWNNICAGPGDFMAGGVLPFGADTLADLITTDISSLQFIDPVTYDYHIPVGSPAQSGGVPAGIAHNGYPLVAWYEYVHPADGILRCQQATLDIGAFAHCTGTGIDAPVEGPAISVRPNPSVDEFLVSPVDATIAARLFDAQGRPIHAGQQFRDGQLSIRAGHLPAGMYLLQVGKARFLLSLVH